MSFFTPEEIPSYFVVLVSQSINNQIWLQDFGLYYSQKVTSVLTPRIENLPQKQEYGRRGEDGSVSVNLPLFGDELTTCSALEGR